MIKRNKVHLGDSVYVEYDGAQFILTLEDGNPDPLTIMLLDYEAMLSLIRYFEKVKAVNN